MCDIVPCKGCGLTFRACDGDWMDMFEPCEIHQAKRKARMEAYEKNGYKDWLGAIKDSFNAHLEEKIITD